MNDASATYPSGESGRCLCGETSLKSEGALLLPLQHVLDWRAFCDPRLVSQKGHSMAKPTAGRVSLLADAMRSHCATCGAPIHLEYDGQDRIALLVGSMDHPEAVRPSHYYGCENRLPWVDIGPTLPAGETREAW